MSLRGHRRGSETHVPTERYLIVRVAAQRFALSADLIQGLLTLEESRSMGILTVQGHDYPSLDLAGRLGLAEAGDGSETRFVLASRAGARACIRVEQVYGLLEVERARVLPLPGQFRGEERNWYIGLILLEEGVAVGLNSAWLIGGEMQGEQGLMAQEEQPPQLAHVVSEGIGRGLAC
jgi:chemotaxis signal transduction protein